MDFEIEKDVLGKGWREGDEEEKVLGCVGNRWREGEDEGKVGSCCK